MSRLRFDISQKTFAKKAKIPQSVIARMESRKHSISFWTLNLVAPAFGIQVQLV
ncbi:MAG TPA: hypothetical protein DDX26_02050 [Candidatus Yonathbacteria bacterium]|nr:MAG: XRE family transcriptional regulator [Patescibacteria group bacterium]HBH71625.1 hypothetical protein [Candidatus Yonathbacteria bacterium]